MQWDRQTRHRHGLTLAGSGLCLLALAGGVSLPVMHAGAALMLVGALVADLPFYRMPGWRWFLLAALWAWLAKTVAWLSGSIGAPAVPWPDKSICAWLLLPTTAIITRNPAWRRRIGTFLVFSLTAGCLLALIQFIVGFDAEVSPWRIDPTAGRGERVSGFFSYHLTQAFVMAAVLLVLALPGEAPICRRRTLWLGRVVTVTGLILTQARGVFLGICCGAFAALTLRGRRQFLRGSIVLTCLAVVALLGLLVVRPGLLTDLRRHQGWRTFIWSVAVDAAHTHPVLGLGGKDAFRAFYRDRLKMDRPDAFFTLDPDHPEPMLAAHPEVLRDPRMQRDLDHYRRLEPGDPRKAWVRQRVLLMFNELSGKASLFPEGAPHAHSSLLTLAAFFGTPCALAYLIGMILLALAGWRRRRHNPAAAGLLIGLIVFALVAGLFEDFVGDSEGAYLLMLCLGLTWARLEDGATAAESLIPEGIAALPIND